MNKIFEEFYTNRIPKMWYIMLEIYLFYCVSNVIDFVSDLLKVVHSMIYTEVHADRVQHIIYHKLDEMHQIYSQFLLSYNYHKYPDLYIYQIPFTITLP